MAIRLTKRVIDELVSDDPRGQKFYDSTLSGFCVAVYASGKKVFMVRYGTRDRRSWITVGPYGVLTIEVARERARELLSKAVLGQNPAAEIATNKTAPTFEKWREDYVKEIEKRKKSWKKDESFLKDAGESWDKRLLKDIAVADVNKLFQQMQERGKITANRWLAAVRTCFSTAWRLDLIHDNPASKVRLLPENPPRQRVLSDDELTAMVDAIVELKDPHLRLAFTLLLETGARLSEVLRATWEDIDLEQAAWRLPSPKSGRPQTIPLAPSTVAILKHTPAMGPYLVPGRDPKKPRFDLKRPWDDLCKEAGLVGVHIHDVRRTYGLHAARQAGLHIASKLLRHSTVTVTERVYVPLGLDDLRKGTAKVSRERGKVIKLVHKKQKTEGSSS
jgi:integrase